ncbi:membrane protein insertase YidC [Alistipes sp. OttesenSCG-928-B03]|nr:membrane protein insertase YidC [Alistipes sp. OttesenSCG-928-B03]
MDRNTVIGLVLVGVIIFGFSWYGNRQAKEAQEAKRIADSIAYANRPLEPEILEPFEADPIAAGEQSAESEAMQDSLRRVRMGDALVNAEAGEEEMFTIENSVIRLTFSNKGGKVVGAEMKDPRYVTYYGKEQVQLYTDGSAYFNMGFFLGNQYLNTGDYFFEYAGTETIDLPEGKTAERIMMRLPVDSMSYVQYAYTLFEDDYMVDFDIDFVNLRNMQSLVNFAWGAVVPQQEKGFDNENKYSTIAYKAPGSDSVDDIGISDGARQASVKSNLQWIAFKQQFFSTVFVARQNFQNAELAYETYQPVTNPELGNGRIKKFQAEANIIYDQNIDDYGFRIYFGPNKYTELKPYDMKMERLVNLGWSIVRWVNTILVIPVFNFLSKYIGSFGIIILLLTLMVKILILPLTYKSYLSMGKMRLIKPELDAINAKFPKQEDAMKKQQATMALYKQAGVSPMGGCLPMLIQMPVIMALFFFFPTSIELRGESFLWAEDLSTYDTILKLPFSIPWYGDHISLFTLLMAVSMFLSTKLNSQSQPSGPGGGSMKFLTYIMPVMLLIWFNNYASGLTYYYLLSNLFTIGQQWGFKYFVNDDKLHARMQAAAAAKTSKTATKKGKGKSKWQQRYEEMVREQQKQARQKKH